MDLSRKFNCKILKLVLVTFSFLSKFALQKKDRKKNLNFIEEIIEEVLANGLSTDKLKFLIASN